MAIAANRRFEGLKPALDHRQRGQPAVLEGRNFMLNAEGPYSAFGAEFVTYQKLNNPEDVQTFRIGTFSVITQPTAFLRLDETSQHYYPVVTFTDGGEVFPWKHAQVAFKHFFAKKGQDLVVYDEVSGEWSSVTPGSDDVPVGCCSVATSAGRLVVQGSSVSAWSAIDNGLDLAPSTATGAGFQSLAIVGGGEPLGVYANDTGFISYTTHGVMRSEYVNASNPFRHEPLSNRRHVPLNPYCVLDFEDDTHILLTKTGLYITAGKKPEPWQPLMSEYLTQDVLPFRDLSIVPVIRLTYNADRKWFFISIAENSEPTVYRRAFVLYIPMDEWGSFDRPHTAFGELRLEQNPDSGYNFGYVCPYARCLRNFSENPRVETYPSEETAVFYHKKIELAPRVLNGVTYFGEWLQSYPLSPSYFYYAAVSGFYTIEPGDLIV